MKKLFGLLLIFLCLSSYAEEKKRMLFLDESEYKQLLIDEERAKQQANLKIQKGLVKSKEKGYHLFKEGRRLILKSQNMPFSSTFKRGLEHLHAVIALDSNRPIYFAVLGDAYNVLSAHNMPNATSISLSFYNKALALDESLHTIHLKAAMLCVKTALYKKSLNYFEKALDHSPIYLKAEILDWMNIAYLYVPQTKRGIEFYSHILKKYPEVDILHLYKAILLKSSFRTKEAEEVILELISNSNTSKKTTDLAYKFLKRLENNNENN